MRVAVRPTGEKGRRAVHVLIADPRVEAVGLLGTRPSNSAGGRLVAVALIGDNWDVLVLDAAVPDPEDLAQAVDAGIPVVLAGARPPDVTRGTFVEEAVPRGALLASLATLESERFDGRLVAAWTESGQALGRGVRVVFPDPLGALTGKVAAPPPHAPRGTYLAAPGARLPWQGLAVTHADHRRVGVADHAAFLEGLTLAAAALAFDSVPGPEHPGWAAALVRRAMEHGLVVASPEIG